MTFSAGPSRPPPATTRPSATRRPTHARRIAGVTAISRPQLQSRRSRHDKAPERRQREVHARRGSATEPRHLGESTLVASTIHTVMLLKHDHRGNSRPTREARPAASAVVQSSPRRQDQLKGLGTSVPARPPRRTRRHPAEDSRGSEGRRRPGGTKPPIAREARERGAMRPRRQASDDMLGPSTSRASLAKRLPGPNASPPTASEVLG